MESTIIKELSGVAFTAVALAFMYVAKLLNDMLAKAKGYDPDHAIEEESNLAVGLRRAGFYLAIPLAMYGSIAGPSGGFLPDLMLVALDGVIALVLIFAARFINDKLLLTGVDNSAALAGGNIAVGLVECGAYIATGLIAMASFSGAGGGLLATVVFFALGQFGLIFTFRLYDLITSWSVAREVKAGNPAAGLMLGGMLIAIAVAIFGAIAGDFTNWVNDLAYFALHASVALLLLLILSKIVDPLFLPNTTIAIEVERDRNLAAVAVIVAIKISLALMISAALS